MLFGVTMMKRYGVFLIENGWRVNTSSKVADTYTEALETVNPRRATPNLHKLYISFARFFEEGGVSGKAEPDLDSARKILEKATKVNFKGVEDLAEIWCEWAELELRQEYVGIS